MGQKVNPHGMRVGVIKDWDSRWFTSKQAFGDTLVEDHKIRTTLKKQLYSAGIPKIEIERTVDSQTGNPRVKVNVFCAKPGIVIGKGGAESAKLEKQLAKMTGKNVNLNIVEVKGTSTTAQLVAEDVASQLERRIAFRRAMKQVIRNAMQPRGGVPAKGIKVTCSGRLAGADIARVESYHEGTIPCRPCALTSTTASLRPTPPTARSASRCGSTRVRSSRAPRPLPRRKEANSNVTAETC